MKRRGRADEALAAVRDEGFKAKLRDAIMAKGTGAEMTGAVVRELARPLLPFGALDAARVTFRWDPEERKVTVLVKGASTGVDEQAEALG